MSDSKAARWLDLVAYLLQHRFPVTREQIFEQVRHYAGDHESARRKFERDKVELRALGIEIESVSLPDRAGDEPATGYRLRAAGLYLPTFELEDAPARELPYPGLPRVTLSRDELAILDRATRRLAQRTELPLAEAAGSARRKLAFDLPLDVDTLERIIALPLPDESRRALTVLQQATADRIAVACRYYSIGRDAEAERVLEPYGLLFQWSQWYCVARARDRDAIRVFRLDRIREARPLDGPDARFQVPDSFDIRRYAGRAPWELGEGPPTAVRVRFEFPESHWMMNRRTGVVVEQEPDGAATVEFQVRHRAPFLRWVLSLQQRAAITSPEDMAGALDALRRRVAALYGEAPA